jgi:hypothetical protein
LSTTKRTELPLPGNSPAHVLKFVISPLVNMRVQCQIWTFVRFQHFQALSTQDIEGKERVRRKIGEKKKRRM